MGFYTIGQLAAADLDLIFTRLGVIGRMLWHYSNGRDTTPIAYKDDRPEVLTIGNSTTALADMNTLDDILGYTAKLCGEVSESLRSSDMLCNGIMGRASLGRELGLDRAAEKVFLPHPHAQGVL